MSALITLDALKASVEALTAKQAADTAALKAMFDTSQNGIVEKLHRWAGAGFPLGFVVLSTGIAVPPTCLDGVARTLPEYVAHLMGEPIENSVAALQAQLEGITLGWSMPGGQVQVVITG